MRLVAPKQPHRAPPGTTEHGPTAPDGPSLCARPRRHLPHRGPRERREQSGSSSVTPLASPPPMATPPHRRRQARPPTRGTSPHASRFARNHPRPRRIFRGARRSTACRLPTHVLAAHWWARGSQAGRHDRRLASNWRPRRPTWVFLTPKPQSVHSHQKQGCPRVARRGSSV